MKKICFLMIMLISISAFSQQKNFKRDRAPKMSSEELATIASKKLALKLDLNESQRVAIQTLHNERFEKRKAIIAERRSESKEGEVRLSTRYEIMNARLDQQIAHQAKMKEILNQDQYKQWKTSKERSPKRRSHHTKADRR